MTAKQHSKPIRNMISITKAAEIIGCHPHTIRRRIAGGELIGYRVGGRIIRVDLSEVERLLRPIPTSRSVI